MNRRVFLVATAMTPVERALGRFMRAPEHPGFGEEGGNSTQDSSQVGDNNSGNDTTEDNDSQPEDNSGQPPSLDKFWEQKPEDEAGDDDSEEAGKAVGAELAKIIEGAQFSPLFTKEIAEQIAEGNFDSANEVFTKSLRHAMAQNTGIFAKLLEAFGQRQMQIVEARIAKTIGNTQAVETLESEFPAAKDPTARPIIESVFNQALVNQKGNRKAAVAETKRLLKAFGKTAGLTTPPPDSGSPISSSASQSLVDELLGRGSNNDEE